MIVKRHKESIKLILVLKLTELARKMCAIWEYSTATGQYIRFYGYFRQLKGKNCLFALLVSCISR